MGSGWSRRARWLGAGAFQLTVCASLCLGFGVWAIRAEEGGESPTLVRIEEEWELTIGTPDAESVGPQVICSTSPRGNVEGVHATFELNHQTSPSFAAGGLHLHLWNGETRLGSVHASSRAVLNTPGEVVTWKTTLHLWHGYLIAWVSQGDSSTWGPFGEGCSLVLIAQTDLANLNDYSPQVSVQQSGVSFGGNRVQSLKLKKVRGYLSNDQVIEDGAVRVVHALE